MSTYSIELMDWTSEETYIIPLGDGSLSDLLSTTPGTYTDDDNNSWTLTGGTSDNDYYVFTTTGDNLPGRYQIGDIYECMHQIGIDLYHCGQQLMDFLPLGNYSFIFIVFFIIITEPLNYFFTAVDLIKLSFS